jgi:hypothetical protein
MSSKVRLARSVSSLCCHATKPEGQREVSGYTLFAQIVAGTDESLRLNIPPLGLRQTRPKQLAGRHANTADLGGAARARTLLRVTRVLLLWCCLDRRDTSWRCRLAVEEVQAVAGVAENAKKKQRRKTKKPPTNKQQPYLWALFVVQHDSGGAGKTPTKQGGDCVRKQQRSRGRRRCRGVCKWRATTTTKHKRKKMEMENRGIISNNIGQTKQRIQKEPLGVVAAVRAVLLS